MVQLGRQQNPGYWKWKRKGRKENPEGFSVLGWAAVTQTRSFLSQVLDSGKTKINTDTGVYWESTFWIADDNFLQCPGCWGLLDPQTAQEAKKKPLWRRRTLWNPFSGSALPEVWRHGMGNYRDQQVTYFTECTILSSAVKLCWILPIGSQLGQQIDCHGFTVPK